MSRGAQQPVCPWPVVESTGVSIRGTGDPTDPFVADIKISQEEGNEVQRTARGLRHLIPTQLVRRPAVRVGAETAQTLEDDNRFPQAVEFSEILYDTAGIWDGSAFIVPRRGVYVVGGFVRVRHGEDSSGEINASVAIRLNNLRRIVGEGPRVRSYFGAVSNISTEDVFDQGDRLQIFFEPNEATDRTEIIEDRYFYLTYRGDSAAA